MSTVRPLIAVVSCHKMIGSHPAQAVYQKYIDAVNFHGGNAILLPYTAADDGNFAALMALVDGVLLTGSYSNVAPARYNAVHVEDKQDVTRDELSFKLLAHAEKSGMPLLAICRGLQEMNVYFGGTLHPDWREVDGFYEPHLEDSNAPVEVQYQPVHDVLIEEEGRLAKFNSQWRVNSLHKQAISKVGANLFVEARARDGLIEAISVVEHPFMIGVQWHPEADYAEDAFSEFLFMEFIHHASQQSTE